jgi:hypothetical protein
VGCVGKEQANQIIIYCPMGTNNNYWIIYYYYYQHYSLNLKANISDTKCLDFMPEHFMHLHSQPVPLLNENDHIAVLTIPSVRKADKSLNPPF